MNLRLTKHVTENYKELSQKEISNNYIKQEDFNNSFDNILGNLSFYQNSKIFIGVSGGSDSMLLSFFIKRWSEIHKREIEGIIVDHGLRKYSQKETLITQKRLKILGVKANIFKLNFHHKKSGIQEWARYERLSLLTGITSLGKGILVLGHHLNDQAETILMRMKKNTGFKGAAGINPCIKWYGVPIIRPMLCFPKSQILLTCFQNKISYELDPSNSDEKFERVKERNNLEKLDDTFFSLKNLDRMSTAIRKINNQIDKTLNQSMFENVTTDQLGWCKININWFEELNQKVAKKILSYCLKMIGGQRYPAHRNKINNIYKYIINNFNKSISFSNRTIAGCKIRKWNKKLVIVRLPKKYNEIITIPFWEKIIFDGRWIISGNIGDKFSYPNINEAIQIRKTIDPYKKYPWEIWSSIPFIINGNNTFDFTFNLDETSKDNHVLDVMNFFYRKDIKIKFNKYSL